MRFLCTIFLLGGFLVDFSIARGQGSVAQSTASIIDQESKWVAGRVIVKLKDEVAQAAASKREPVMQMAEDRAGIRHRRSFSNLPGFHVLEFDANASITSTIETLKATGVYEMVVPDRILHALKIPNEPNYASGVLWSLHNTGTVTVSLGVVAPGPDISAAAGWDIQSTAPDVIVAIIDSGMRLTHTDLAANLWTNPSPATGTASFTNDLHGINAITGTGDPTDDNGHGTHVAGIIGAVGNNGIGSVGVAWKVQLMPLKFLDSSGSGAESDAITCIDYAIAHKASIINASYGSTGADSLELAAIKRARDAGIIFVTAAGNDGVNSDGAQNYPANYPLDNIISVAWMDQTDHLASKSNYGPGSVEIAAPGDLIYSTYNTSDTAYTRLSGTSMASPHVAGAMALLKQHFPTDTYRQLINRVLRSVDKNSAYIGKVQSGGRLNLAKALSTTSTAPFNDNFADRAQLTGSIISIRSSNVDSSAEAGEPAHAGVPGGRSLWWTWTAPFSTTAFFDTTGSDYDTLLAVYTGNSLNSLTPVGSNDDNPVGGTKTSRVTVSISAGTTYQIAVDGKNGATGFTTLQIGAIPANDSFAGATTLTGSSVSVADNNTNASSDAGEPNHAGNAAGHSLWYKWVAPTSGQYQASVFSASVDFVLAAYTSTASATATFSSLKVVASNDNSRASIFGINNTPLITINATQGTTYYLAVDSASSSPPVYGDYTLTIVDSAWQFPTFGTTNWSSPAVGADGSIYVGSSDDATFYAVNPDGSLKWQYFASGGFSQASPSIGADGTVYVGCENGYFYAFDGAKGTRKWRYLFGTSALSTVSSTPAIASDGTVYFKADDHYLYALSTTTVSASLKWKLNLNESDSSYSSPAIGSDGTIYVGSADGNLYAVNPNGTVKWKFGASGEVYTSPAIASNGTIYVGDTNGAFYGINPDGTQKWIHVMGAGASSSPVIGPDGTVYFGGIDKNIHAFNGADGTTKWEYTAGDIFRASSPAIAADGTLYIGCYDGNLYAINPNGTLKRTYASASLIRSAPALANGRVYFMSQDGKLYAVSTGSNLATSAWPMFQKNALHTGLSSSTTSSASSAVKTLSNGRLAGR